MEAVGNRNVLLLRMHDILLLRMYIHIFIVFEMNSILMYAILIYESIYIYGGLGNREISEKKSHKMEFLIFHLFMIAV